MMLSFREFCTFSLFTESFGMKSGLYSFFYLLWFAYNCIVFLSNPSWIFYPTYTNLSNLDPSTTTRVDYRLLILLFCLSRVAYSFRHTCSKALTNRSSLSWKGSPEAYFPPTYWSVKYPLEFLRLKGDPAFHLVSVSFSFII